MTVAKTSDTPPFRQPLLSEPEFNQRQPQPPQYVVVVPPYLPFYRHRRRRNPQWCGSVCLAASLLVFAAAVFLLWPSNPELSIARLNLHHLHFHTSPKISLDVTLDLTVKVRNKDFYSIDYDSLLVAIGYRGERLGFMTSDGGGHIRARGSSYLNTTLRLDGVEVLSDVLFLLEDLAKGSIMFDTESVISGKLRLFFIELSLKTKISCEVFVSTHNQTITQRRCYPQV